MYDAPIQNSRDRLNKAVHDAPLRTKQPMMGHSKQPKQSEPTSFQALEAHDACSTVLTLAVIAGELFLVMVW